MELFQIVAMLLTLAALFAYANERLFGLPNTIGIMLIGLVLSLLLLLVDAMLPGSGGEFQSMLAIKCCLKIQAMSAPGKLLRNGEPKLFLWTLTTMEKRRETTLSAAWKTSTRTLRTCSNDSARIRRPSQL